MKPSIFPPNLRGYRGARFIPTTARTPAQFLGLFFDEEMLQRFVDQTNSYVSKQAKPAWIASNPLTIALLRKFFGLVLYMGIVNRPNRRMYLWQDKIFGDRKVVSNIMSRDMFLNISYNLHWKDTSDVTPQDRYLRNKADGFWTVADMLDSLAEKYRYYYEPGHTMSIDEMCIFFKGRHRCRCYNPKKPNKWHLKVFCLNDSQTGYLSNFFYV